jgi:hypothetical protein
MAVTTSGTVRLHRLTMVPQDDGVMVGRPDTGSYALFPAEGAQALRLLESGRPISEVATWYADTCGETLDVDDFLEAISDLGFLLADDEDRAPETPVRWQRLGRWTFSRPAFVGYAGLILTGLLMIIHDPGLRPSYHRLFFTHYLSLIPLTLTLAQIPCILLHEGFHALAGRRLGLPSTLRLGRRLYYLVAETRLTALLSVPRQKRFLPFLAGMLADALVISALTVAAALLQDRDIPAWCPRFCVALAFTGVLRLIWQLMFYLETDLYYVLATALRCSDLQNATRFFIKNQVRGLLRRDRVLPPAEWADRDQEMARWYSVLLIAGYGFSLGTVAWAGLPTTVHFWSLIFDRLARSHTSTQSVVDAVVFISMTATQAGLTIFVVLRDRRAGRRNSSKGALA